MRHSAVGDRNGSPGETLPGASETKPCPDSQRYGLGKERLSQLARAQLPVRNHTGFYLIESMRGIGTSVEHGDPAVLRSDTTQAMPSVLNCSGGGPVNASPHPSLQTPNAGHFLKPRINAIKPFTSASVTPSVGFISVFPSLSFAPSLMALAMASSFIAACTLASV